MKPKTKRKINKALDLAALAAQETLYSVITAALLFGPILAGLWFWGAL